MKLERGRRAMWLTFNGIDWTCLGKDSDSLSIEPSPDSESFKNVQGETSFRHNGYTPKISVTYTARDEDAIYPYIQEIADTLATDDERISATLLVATLTAEVSQTYTLTATGKGFTVPVKVVIDNDGGGTDGYDISFTATEAGARIKGTVSVKDKIPTFTPIAA